MDLSVSLKSLESHIDLLLLSGPDFGFDVFSGGSNESYNTSLELGMFSDVGVTHGHVLLGLNCLTATYRFPWSYRQYPKWTMTPS